MVSTLGPFGIVGVGLIGSAFDVAFCETFFVRSFSATYYFNYFPSIINIIIIIIIMNINIILLSYICLLAYPCLLAIAYLLSKNK